jgi:hypothetical protein
VTEPEWLEGTDPRPLWAYLGAGRSARKTRLFVCACCRRVWDLLTDERSRQAVEEAERYADGGCGQETLAAARRKADAAYQWSKKQHGATCSRHFGAAHLALQATALPLRWDPREEEFLRGAQERKDQVERKARSELTRHFFGNPFRPYPVPLSWPALVVDLAQQLYTGADVRLILHDALLDAGHAELADHFRTEEAHPKGCFALDALLDRE